MKTIHFACMEFPLKLSKLIDLRETNQTKLAAKAGVAQSAISEMTKGKRRPYGDQAFRIARALKVTADFLLDDALSDPPDPEKLKEEAYLLRSWRKMGIDADTAVAWLMAARDADLAARACKAGESSDAPRSGGGKPDNAGPWKPGSTALDTTTDVREEERRREAKRSGVDPGAHVNGTDPPSSPPLPKRRRKR